MHAFRSLLKSPGFTSIAVVALALGIGANTAIFSVVYGVLLRALPYPDQERLVVVHARTEQQPNLSLSYPNFLDWRERQRSFTAIGVGRNQPFNDIGPGGAERIPGAQVTHDFLVALGVAPIRGRLFTADDDRPGAPPTVVVRESFARRRFGDIDAAIGAKLQLGPASSTVIGVLPDAMQYPGRNTEVWEPLGLSIDHPSYRNRNNHPGLYGIARLKPEATPDAAHADLRRVAAELATLYPDSNAGQSAAVQLLSDRTFGQVQPMLLLLLGAAGFVLLIACANVANLQLARAHSRAREFAVRTALGAGRARLIRQLLAESVLLGTFGSLFGVLVGAWAIAGLRAVLPANIPRLAEASLNGWVLAFAIGAGLLTTTVFGLIPALHASRQDLRSVLAAGGRHEAAAGRRWRAALIVGEFALTFVLLVGAGLMIRTLANLYRADSGFNPQGVVAFNWALPGTTTYADPAKRTATIGEALVRLAQVPGVARVGVVSPLPLSGSGNNGAFYVEGTSIPAAGQSPWAERAHVSADYFVALGIPLLSGRTFSAHDTASAPKVAIVDASFADQHLGGASAAVGKRFVYGNRPPANPNDWYQVVGVVAHLQNTGPGNPTRLQTYVPYTQLPPVAMSFALQLAASNRNAPASEQGLAALMPALRRAIHEVDPELPIFGEATLEALFDSTVSTQRLTMLLLGTFAALALLLAAVGLYGVLNYNIGQRTREIGVRMALGAPSLAVVQLVVRQGMTLAGIGLCLGLAAACVSAHLLSRILYGVSALDPLNLAAVTTALAAIGALACWLPARRAARVDPMTALRAE